VATETSRIVLEIGDELLISAVAPAAEHFAERVGFEQPARRDFGAASEEAAREAFALMPGPEQRLQVTIEDYFDRVEIGIEYKGPAEPVAGLETFLPSDVPGSKAGGASLLRRVDRVQYTSRGNVSRMTLIKYLHSHPTSQ
jgi:hypothetical protein